MQDYSEVYSFLDSLAEKGDLTYERNAPLAQYSSFKIGGPCSLAVFPKSRKRAVELLRGLRGMGKRILVFGNASNVLFCDKGIDGIVIFTTGFKEIILDGEGVIHADAGASLTSVSQFAQKNGFEGFEFACGIPGNIGGGAFMNAGAYEHSVSECIVGCVCFDMKSGEVRYIPASEIKYGYRTSSFQDSDLVILNVEIKLKPASDPEKVRELMNDHLRSRNEKQPLEYPSAGSVFKRYPGYFTSKLIDEAGLKGLSVGGAEVSQKHAGFIVNKGGATASDVMLLIKQVQDRIFALHGIHIECEVRYIV